MTAAQSPVRENDPPPSGVATAAKTDKTHDATQGQSDDSVVRASGSIAFATLISRITGFLRTILTAAILGGAVASSFQAAYSLPSMVSQVVLEAVLTAIIIPVLVRAESEDEDKGQGFTDRIFTLALTTLSIATIIAVACAPLLTLLNLGEGKVNRDLSTAFAYLLLPEVLFYGMSALFIAILNMRGAFKPGAWAPVLNNVVQISTLVAFLVVPGEITLDPVRLSDPKILVLGVGTTLGVVLQCLILVPAMRKAGVRLRLRWGLDARLKKFGAMAGAIVMYVAVLQVGFFITYRIASAAAEWAVAVYAYHWQLLQLPYGVLGVTILTTIMPRLSRNAAADDTEAVVDDMSLATRLTMVSLVPVVAYMTFFGGAIALTLFNFGRFEEAPELGMLLTWGAFTLIPYSMTLVQLRVFYAREDAWTPTFMTVGITVVKVALSYLGPVLFDDPARIAAWLAFSNGVGYFVGAIVGHLLLRRRLGAFRMTNVGRTIVPTLVASVVCMAVVWAVAEFSGLGPAALRNGPLTSAAYVGFTAIIGLGMVYTALTLARVPDVVSVGLAVRRVLGRVIPRLAPPARTQAEADERPLLTVEVGGTPEGGGVPYAGQVEVLQRYDDSTASWQTYSVHSGGAVGRLGSAAAPEPRSLRHRMKGGTAMNGAPHGPRRDSGDPAAGRSGEPASGRGAIAPGQQPTDIDPPEPVFRGPRLVPGASVAGGRYRLLSRHGGARGLQFWQARDLNLDRDVALTFVDAEQRAPRPAVGERPSVRGAGPQSVLSRTLRLGRIDSPGLARVLDVVRGSSGGIVVSEWVPGSPLAAVTPTHPSPVAAARAVRGLAKAAESAHRAGVPLSVDHPDRIRISVDGNAVLAFPGSLEGDGNETDVRGIGAVLYALLTARWPLAPSASRLATSTTDDEDRQVGGIPIAHPAKDSTVPANPRTENPAIPYEIAEVAWRALAGEGGIRTAAAIAHVLDQVSVADDRTELIPAARPTGAAVAPAGRPRETSPAESRRHTKKAAITVGAILLAVLLVAATLVFLLSDGDESRNNPGTFFGGSSSTEAPKSNTPALAAFTDVRLVPSGSEPTANLTNIISGRAPAWRTFNYRGDPAFGGEKTGTGVLLILREPTAVTAVTIRTPTPGIDVEIRSMPSEDAGFSGSTRLAQSRLTQESTTLAVSTGPIRHVLIWITTLSQVSDGSYQAGITQVTATA